MTQVIDTLGKAMRHGMLVRTECAQCGNRRFYKASDLVIVFGPGRDPRSLRFRCDRCRPPEVRITLLEVDRDRMRSVTIHEPFWDYGKVVAWMPRRLR